MCPEQQASFLSMGVLVEYSYNQVKLCQLYKFSIYKHNHRISRRGPWVVLCASAILYLVFFTDLKERNKRKDKLSRNFTEGWVEFISKRVAKEIATNLNMTQVGGKKRSKYF